MKKKILFSFLALAVAIAVIPMFAAFEAHVINVTAKIENALSVPLESLDFGTVFPQEELDKTFDVSLSESFQAEDRVDDIEYIIRQKPKCWNEDEADPQFGRVTEDAQDNYVCVDDGYVMLPLLCPYLSKHEITEDGQDTENDEGIKAFHGPIVGWTSQHTLLHQVAGKLIKSLGDLTDTWNIDLKAPCFGSHCAQDWADFVLGINDEATPEDYIQPVENEHKLFGCDLWLEVTGVSLPNGLVCGGPADVMSVLDRSLSIDAGELATMKTAAKAFVAALNPNGGPHMGQSSFAPSATLDLHLTNASSTIIAAIDALSTAGGSSTNLEDGILVATAELDDAHVHERPAVPDYMVIITDGAANDCNDPGCVPEDAAEAAADAAKAASIEIYVVGVGVSTSTATFLETKIASGSDHYFDAADFDQLEQILEDLVSCP